MKAITKTIMVLSLLLVSATSFAGGLDFTPMSTDKMMMAMNSIFGKLGVFGGETSDSMAGLIEMINGSALLVAGILLVYYALYIILGTAHDGEFMGKKFAGPWLTVRIGLVASLILPVHDGYNTIQILAGRVITTGIYFADSGASKFMSNSNLIQVAQTGLIKPEVNGLAYNLFASYACMNVIKQFQQTDEAKAKLLFPEMSIGITKENGINNTVYKFGDKNGTQDVCGTLTVSNWQVPSVDAGQTAQNALTGPLGGITNLVQASDAISRMKAITQKNQEETANLMTKMDTLSAQMVSSGTPIDPKQIADAVGQYRENVNSFASQQILSLDQFAQLKKSVDQDGFIFLGAYYQKISKLMDLTNSAIANVPVASGVSHFGDSYPLKDEWSKALNNINKVVNLSDVGVVNYGVGDETGGTNESWMDTLKHTVSEGFSPMPIIKKLFTSAGTMTFNSNENGVLKIERIGGWSGAVAGAVYGGVAVLSSSIGNAPGIGLFLNTTLKIFIPPIMMFSFFCLYIIPMLPFFIWFGMVMALMISYAETIVGSTLWVLAMLFEGHEIIGQGSNGFKQLLSILFKPLLMVVGFALSVSMVQIAGSLLTAIFPDVWNLAQSDSGIIVYVLGMFAMPFVYVAIMTYIIKTCFGIVHVLPDQVINWIGGLGVSMSGHGKEASSAGAFAGGSAVGLGTKLLADSMDKRNETEKKSPVGSGLDKANTVFPSNERQPNQDGNPSNNRKSVLQAESNILDNLDMANNSYSGTKAKKALDSAFNMVGGRNSDEGEKFINQLNDSIERKPYADFQKQVDSAMNRHFIDSFGSGSGRVISQAGNGYLTPEAKQTKELFQSAMDKMNSSGIPLEAGKERITKANSEALNRFENDSDSINQGGNMGLNDYFVSEINKELPESQRFFEPTIDKSENNS